MPNDHEPTTSYLLCCVQRSGSWLLAHSLADTGVAGLPRDYFDDAEYEQNRTTWGTGSFLQYLAAVRSKAATWNGVFGTKMMWNDFSRFRDALRRDEHDTGSSDPQVLATVFPGLKYVWLRREDKIRQGISWWRAAATEHWVHLVRAALGSRQGDLRSST